MLKEQGLWPQSALVWGLGHIGGSTYDALFTAGLEVFGVDPNSDQIDKHLSNGAKASHLATSISLLAEDSFDVHFVAVSTELNGQPWHEPVKMVTEAIAEQIPIDQSNSPPLIVFESTLTPGTAERVVMPILTNAGLEIDEDVLLAVAPRRDWFSGPDKTLRTLDRVFGCAGPRSSAAARVALSIVSDSLHEASTLRNAELTKVVENLYRQVEISLANELALAFPDDDIVEVLWLAGTKWNIHEYHPSFGLGGYCIPLAGLYLLESVGPENDLAITKSAMAVDTVVTETVGLVAAANEPVLILGLAYRGDVPVVSHSPTITIAKHLRRQEIEHSIYDPHFTAEVIERHTGSSATRSLEAALAHARTILVTADHAAFREDEEIRSLLEQERGQTVRVLDNHGSLSDLSWPPNVSYKRVGSKAWSAPH